ncbi:MAG: hypothetical protein HC880_02290 [Bacteroidia bacterium]|nr:hypothetical protein [Bacteroidia bacterium]
MQAHIYPSQSGQPGVSGYSKKFKILPPPYLGGYFKEGTTKKSGTIKIFFIMILGSGTDKAGLFLNQPFRALIYGRFGRNHNKLRVGVAVIFQ